MDVVYAENERTVSICLSRHPGSMASDGHRVPEMDGFEAMRDQTDSQIQICCRSLRYGKGNDR